MPIDNAERERRRALFLAHMKAEDNHDLDAVMETFSQDAEMLYNRNAFTDPDDIRLAHIYIGMSSLPGAFSGLRSVSDAEHFTDEEIVIEGRLCGKHVAEFVGFAATGHDVELPYVAFYRFDEAGKLASERVVMNLAALGAAAEIPLPGPKRQRN